MLYALLYTPLLLVSSTHCCTFPCCIDVLYALLYTPLLCWCAVHTTVHSLAALMCCTHYCTLLCSAGVLYRLQYNPLLCWYAVRTIVHYCQLPCYVVVLNKLLFTFYCALLCPVGVLYSPFLCITSCITAHSGVVSRGRVMPIAVAV